MICRICPNFFFLNILFCHYLRIYIFLNDNNRDVLGDTEMLDSAADQPRRAFNFALTINTIWSAALSRPRERPQCASRALDSHSYNTAAPRFPFSDGRQRECVGAGGMRGSGHPGHPSVPGGRCLYLLPPAFLLWAVGAGEELKLASSSTLHSSTMTGLGRAAAEETWEYHNTQTYTPGLLSHN